MKDTGHVFRDRESDWGFCEFAPFTSLQPGQHSDDNYNVVIKVRIRLDDSEYGTHNLSYDSKKTTGYVGFKNQGATCYMNSLLQTLYMLVAFRKAVYEMPLPDLDSSDSDMTYALQKVFYELQFSSTVVKTKKLTESFGWETTDAFTQHDVQELNRILCDHLEEKMKKIDPDKPNRIQQLFQGKLLNYIECVDVEYKSTREESFYDLSLNVKGCRGIIDSFEKYTEVEVMDDDNKYRADGFEELQRAKKGAKFLKLPPVLQLHLKRFEYDYERETLVKINDRYEFDTEIDLSPYVERSDGSDVYALHSVLVHIGDVNGGHYHAYIRTHSEDEPEQELARWLKFDDEHVTIATEKDAVSENFGFGGEKDLALNNGLKRGKLEGEDDITNMGLNGQTQPPALTPRRNLQSRRFMNAYMLQYVRKENAANLLKPLGESDIPKELAERINHERRVEVQRQKERLEQHLYMVVAIATDMDLNRHHGADLTEWDKCKQIRIKRALKLGELKMQLQQDGHIRDASKVRIWKCSRRPNETLRPDCLVADGDNYRSVNDTVPTNDMLHNYNMPMYNTRHYDQYAEEPFRIFVEDLCSEYSFGLGESFIEARRIEEEKEEKEIDGVSPTAVENGPEKEENENGNRNTLMETVGQEDANTDMTQNELITERPTTAVFASYPLTEHEILLFFKLYIPTPIPTVQFLGYSVVNRTKDISQILEVLRRPLERYGIHTDPHDNLTLFEEQTGGSVIELDLDICLQRQSVNRGDVIVIQAQAEGEKRKPAAKTARMSDVLDTWDHRQDCMREDEKDRPLGGRPMPRVQDFYSYLRFRIKVEFKDKAAIDNDLVDPNVDDIVGTCLELTKNDSYVMIRKILANSIGNGAHHDFIRFFAHDVQRQSPVQEAVRASDNDQILKTPNMHIMTPHVLANQMNRGTEYRVLWYEKTEYRLAEFEHKEEVKITWRWDGGAKSLQAINPSVITTPNTPVMTATMETTASSTTEGTNGPETSTTSDDISIADDSTTDSTMPVAEKYGLASMLKEDITQCFSILVPPLSKYTMVIEGIRRRQKVDNTTEIRLLEVRNNRIERIVDPNDSVPHLMATYDYPLELRAEPVPVEEKIADEEESSDSSSPSGWTIIAVAHLAKERHRGTRFFGIPFLLRVRKEGMAVKEIRELIFAKLDDGKIKRKEFDGWKLAEVMQPSVHYLEDEDTCWVPPPSHRNNGHSSSSINNNIHSYNGNINSNGGGELLTTLAIEHRCPTPRRYNNQHGRFADKPLKIRA